MANDATPTVFLTGASAGIGRELAEFLIERARATPIAATAPATKP